MANNTKRHNQRKNDNLVLIVGTIIFVGMFCILGIIGIKHYMQPSIAKTYFVALAPMVIKTEDFDLKTAITMRSNEEGEEWLKDNKESVKSLFENAFYSADLKDKSNIEKITYLNQYLKKEVNKKLPRSYIKEILLTEFLISNG